MADYEPTPQTVILSGLREIGLTHHQATEVLAEHAREAAEQAWDEGERHESEHLATFGQFCPHGTKCNPYREEQP